MSDETRERKVRGEARGPTDEELRAAVPRGAGSGSLKVGAFVLAGVVAAVTILFLLTDPATLRGRYMLVTRLPDAGGIRAGDAVTMRGVNIGRIHDFSMTRDRQVDIVLEIEGEWGVPVDSRAGLAGQGLLGGRTMSIEPGAAEAVFEPWDTIPGSAAIGGGLFDDAGDLADQARSVMGRIQALLSEPTVRGVEQSTLELRGLLQELRSIAARQRVQLDDLTASLNRSARGFEEAAGAGPDVRSAAARADSAMVQLNRTAATLERSTASLDRVLARLDAGEGTLGRLMTDDSLYTSLNQAARSIHLLAEDLRANPGRYINVSVF